MYRARFPPAPKGELCACAGTQSGAVHIHASRGFGWRCAAERRACEVSPFWSARVSGSGFTLSVFQLEVVFRTAAMRSPAAGITFFSTAVPASESMYLSWCDKRRARAFLQSPTAGCIWFTAGLALLHLPLLLMFQVSDVPPVSLKSPSFVKMLSNSVNVKARP